MAEPLIPPPDPAMGSRLRAAADLTQRSTHYLRGHLHTILGFSEILAEEDAEQGTEGGVGVLLSLAARRLQARVDGLLYVLAKAAESPPGAAPAPEALGGLLRELTVGRGVPIDCRFPGHRPVPVDVHGLRCLLQEIAALRDPPPAITLAIATGPGGPPQLEITCADAWGARAPAAEQASPPGAAEGSLAVALLDAVATALGGTLTVTESPAGGCDLWVAIPLPATYPPIAGETSA